MEEEKRVVLQPEYMKAFSCIGDRCEDTCCAGWGVQIDKETYAKYKKVENKELEPLMKSAISLRKEGSSDLAYADIKLDCKGRCSFLNEKNLCNVYIHAGEDYLSAICTFYPRIVRKVDGNFERSSVMSCPEATRLCLLNPKGIVFEQVEEAKSKIRIDSVFDTRIDEYKNRAQKYFWDIRIFSLTLLQNRNYTLAERLIMLGMIYRRIENLYANNSVDDVPNMLESMGKIIEGGSIKDEVSKVSSNTQVQMKITQTLTDAKIRQGVGSQRYLNCLEETLEGIGYRDGANINDVIKQYEENYKIYLEPYLREKEYIIENYLVNEYFKELMPFGVYKSIWDSYIFLCVLYGMIKLHMIGMAGYHKEFNDDLAILLIQSFSKVVLHNQNYIQGIIQMLKDNGLDSFGYMAILVKN